MPYKMSDELFNVLFNNLRVLDFWDFLQYFDQSLYILYKHIIPSDNYFTFIRAFLLLLFWRVSWFAWILSWRFFKIILHKISLFLCLPFYYFIFKQAFVNVPLNLLLMLKVFFINIASFCRKNSHKVSSSFIFTCHLFQNISVSNHSKFL